MDNINSSGVYLSPEESAELMVKTDKVKREVKELLEQKKLLIKHNEEKQEVLIELVKNIDDIEYKKKIARLLLKHNEEIVEVTE